MICNQKQLSEIIGISQVSIRAFEREGLPFLMKAGPGKSARYDTISVIKWLIARGGWRSK
jgi:phage terminase Nu1 subunit (DNA packaging protein)